MTWNPFARKPALDIRPGQESVQSDDMAGVFGRLQGIYTFASPSYELEKLGLLELLGKYNPDVSQALKIHVDLGNSGHSIEVEARNAEAVLDRVNWLAANCYSLAGGVDGLVNHFLRQIPLMGALSAEWVVAPALSDGMLDVVIVPVKSIRFRHEDGQWMPYQATGRGFGEAGYVPLNPRTYSYAPIMTEDGKPYALPGLLAALKNIEIQLDAVDGLKSIIRKMGLLGFLDVVLKVPQQKSGESDESFAKRLQSRLKAYAASYSANMSKGVSVHYDDQEAKHTALSAGTAAGAAQIFNLNEEQIFSALDIPPSMAGRSFSTTETYATVDFQRLATKLVNSQRLIKRFLEKGYTLDLLLRGLDASVSVNFNPIAGMNDKEAAETEEIRVKTILSKRDGGIINDDEAAQELGYEKATGFKPSPRADLPLTRFTYNRAAGRYQFTPERIVLEQPADDRRDQSYVAALQAVYEAPTNAAIVEALARAEEVAGAKTSAKTFASLVYAAFKGALLRELAASGIDRVTNQFISNEWRRWRYEETSHLQSAARRPQRLEPRRTLLALDLGVVDANALRYLTTLENWYFGKGNVLADDEVQGKKFVGWLESEYINKGLSIKDASTWDEFRREFPALVKTSSDRKIVQLVSTTMSRVQNMGQTLSLYELGWERYRIVGPKSAPICDYCRSMLGRVFEVKAAANRLAKIVGRGFEGKAQLPPFLASKHTVEEVQEMTDAELQEAGFETPPYHPECRHRKAAED
jgi:hypothetical protein